MEHKRQFNRWVYDNLGPNLFLLADTRGPEAAGRFATILLEAFAKCESPIETAMLPFLVHLECTDGWQVTPQETIEGIGRVDFVLRRLGPKTQIVIECDGHDYHERTKAQAARDRSRDRALQNAGFIVLRFTGSEIAGDLGKVYNDVKLACERVKASVNADV